MPDLELVGGIPKLTSEGACRTANDILGQKQRQLKNILDQAKGGALGEAKRKLLELAGLGDLGLSDSDAAMGDAKNQADGMGDAAKGMVDKVLNGEIVEGSDVTLQTLADCLGGGFDFGFPGKGGIDVSNLKDIASKLLDAIMGLIAKVLDALLDPIEKALMDALAWLKDLLPLDLLDEILNLINCLQGCPNVDQSKLPTVVDIENELAKAGLKITGEPEFEIGPFGGVPGVTPKMKANMGSLLEQKTALENKLADEITGFDKLPKIPEVPSIPRTPNPLKGVSLKDKLEALF